MSTDYLYNRVLGCLVTAGMGDALGAPSEAMDRGMIAAKFGGRIEAFVDGSDNKYSSGARVAEITDDTTQLYEMARAVVNCGGKLTVRAAADALVAWSERHPRFYPNGTGPTTRLVIEELKAGKDPVEIGTAAGDYFRGTTNGAAVVVGSLLNSFGVGLMTLFLGGWGLYFAVLPSLLVGAAVNTIVAAIAFYAVRNSKLLN